MPSSTSRTTKKASTATTIPTPQPPEAKYAPDAWLHGGSGAQEDLVVPSGQTCLVKRPGLEGLIRAGVLREVDSLSAIVSSKHIKKSKKGQPDKVDAQSILKDPAALDEIMHTVDKVVCHCVVLPQVHMTPDDATRREPGVVYADMVGLEDKMFIFNFVVGGTRDLESFRGGLDVAVGGLEAGEGVPLPSE
jgi:hypothetical protein